MYKKIALATVTTLAFAGSAFAQTSFLDDFSGEASLTGGKTTGNTDTEDLALGLKLAKDGDKWRHKFDALVDYGKVDGSSNKQRFATGYQIDRDISERTYVYANADYYNDKFGAFKNGYFVGTGLGYKVILPDPIGWNVEAGAGYRSQATRSTLAQVFDTDGVTPVLGMDGLPTFTGDPSIRNNEFALRGASDFDWAINDKVSLYDDAEIIWSDSDTYIWNEIGLSAQLMGNLAARISYRIDHHTDVPMGTEKTDTATRFGVVYTIK